MKTILFKALSNRLQFSGNMLAYCLLLIAYCLFSIGVSAQTTYSLQQAVEYGIKNSFSVKNAEIDNKSAIARIGETRAIGLPQVSGQVQLAHNFKYQASILDGGADSPFLSFGQTDPNAPKPTDRDVISFLFGGMRNTSTITGTVSQLIFNGSYFVGLQAAKTYKSLSEKTVTSSKITVTENVTKAYYGVLVNEERLTLLKVNVERLEKTLNETREFNRNGFVEKIDVDRLEVQFNNLKIEAEKVERLVALSYDLLKFQMGMPLSEKITLSDKLIDMTNATFTPMSQESIDYNKRIEYQQLLEQKTLNQLDVKNLKMTRYPTLGASFTYGYNPAATRLKDITQSARWISYSYLGLNLNIPIFDGLGTHYKIQQKRLVLEQTENNIEQFKRSTDLQVTQYNITLENALESLKTQKRNLDLANEVVRVTRIKYQQGVGSNIEVLNAEASLKEAQTNYYAALYDTLIAKVDLDKATGTLGTK